MQTKLFSPIQVGNLTLKNRIVVPPMCMWKAVDGMAQNFHRHHYAALAASGVGTIVIEATAVTPNGRISPWCLGIWDDEHAQGIASIVQAIKETSPEVKVILQLAHAGRKASCSPETDSTIPESLEAGVNSGWQTVAPSAEAAQEKHITPRALETEEIPQYVQRFADAAKRAVAIGLDGVMIHAAHGYLIHEFLSPLSNHRTDAYGGSYENRSRFANEVMQAVKQAVPADFTVGIRISATDWLDGGWNLEESIKLVKQAEELGLAFVDVSTGGLVPCKIPVAPSYQLPFAQAIKQQTKMVVGGVGMITNAFQAETALQLQACDVIDIGRGILTDLNWGWHAARDLHAEVQPPLERVYTLRF